MSTTTPQRPSSPCVFTSSGATRWRERAVRITPTGLAWEGPAMPVGRDPGPSRPIFVRVIRTPINSQSRPPYGRK